MKDLSIIIVNYNSRKYLLDCLKSIEEHVKDIDFEIVVVDNNSSETLTANDLVPFKRVKLVLSPKNLGFGGGNNLGVSNAGSEYLLLLNPDTKIIDDSIQKMMTFMKNHEEIGALSALLYGDDECKQLQSAFFGRFQSLASLIFRHYNYQQVDMSREFFYTDIVTGADLMIKKVNFEVVNGFDENFFMYLEDDDLCKNLVDRGFKNAVLTKAKIVHYEGKSSTSRQKKNYYYNSQARFWQKHSGFWPTLLMRIIRWPYKVLKTL